MGDQLVLRIDVEGRPATFGTATESAWKAAVRGAVAASGCQPISDARFAVRLDFRLAEARTAGEVWDLDNLIKPDDRVDRIEAAKRRPSDAEASGATIEVWVLAPSDP